jgi:GntR family transcriptional repressor for pyruvate dehydrogenase complex
MPVALEDFQAVRIDRPADIVFQRLRALIVNGKLQPNEPLPSERQLAERFGLNRIHVREALQRLEFYGLVKTRPQTGSIVTSSGIRAVEGIFSDVLAIDRDQVAALVETRWIVEVQLARLAAQRATDEELSELRSIHREFQAEVEAGRDGIEPDLRFHLKVADAAHNPVMRSLVGLLAPDIVKLAKNDRTCAGGRATASLAEHERILLAIEARDPEAAARAMVGHMQQGGPLHETARIPGGTPEG